MFVSLYHLAAGSALFGFGGFDDFGGFGGFGFFGLIPMVVFFGFILVFALIGIQVIKGIAEWNRNNNSPKVTTQARVVTKRTNVSHHHNAGMNNTAATSHTSTTYYATFETENKERIEFHIAGEDYGMLAEGDTGTLTYQGSRYLGYLID
ncbi:MAG TPA: DUF2500 domain-containing protein [Clostridiaceae bacterium]|nr:DUF2500 domain-containing protein [Clostridiaceae bacterium]